MKIHFVQFQFRKLKKKQFREIIIIETQKERGR